LTVSELRQRLAKYKDYKIKGRANSGEYDSHILAKNTSNRLTLITEAKNYLLYKYGTLTNLDNYSFEDTQLFIEYMEFQGYSSNFIERIYNVKKSKINWDNIPKTNEDFWSNIDWERFWSGGYN
jgi:hypothetical protein